MHVIDSDGATVGNLFTEGNASLSIPATVVSASIANAWQEEIANVIREVGIPLLTSSTDTFDQLKDAVIELIQRGGRAAPITQSVSNNSGPLDVTDFPVLDTAVVKSVVMFMDIFRRTDSGVKKESGFLYLIWDSEASSWDITFQTVNGDGGVTFSMNNTSGTEWQLQYTSDDLTGTTYSGTLKITDLKQILV